MARRGESFPEEEQTHGALSPGVVTDDEDLERRLPPGAQEAHSGTIPQAAFQRRELQWTEEDGGASVDRCRFVHRGFSSRRAVRNTIKARAEQIRRQTDGTGNRLWSITDRPVPGNPAHAEIQRQPRGKMPGRAERNQLLEVWRGATGLLTVLKAHSALGSSSSRLLSGRVHQGAAPTACWAARPVELHPDFKAQRCREAGGIGDEQCDIDCSGGGQLGRYHQAAVDDAHRGQRLVRRCGLPAEFV